MYDCEFNRLKDKYFKESSELLCSRLTYEADIAVISDVTATEALEFRREQYELTQTEFARILKMQPSHYSEFVNGTRELPKQAMRRAVAIGVPAECVLAI